MGSITISKCPVCQSATVYKKLEAKDYTVSKQVFAIWECAGCTLRFTQDIPDEGSVGSYYQSDEYISHTDTREGLVNRLYHVVRRKTLKKKLRLIQRASGVQRGNLLDIGAGTGAFLHTAQQAGWQTTGLEPDEATRKRALDSHQQTLQNTDALFRLPANSFDAITLWHVLEHVHELHAYMDQIKMLLKKNGRALIAVPNYTARDAEIYGPYWAAYDVPRHLYHFSPAAVINLVQQHGLELHAIKPMWYDSFYISMLSEKYKTGKSHFFRAMVYGLFSNLNALFNKRRCSSVIYIIGK